MENKMNNRMNRTSLQRDIENFIVESLKTKENVKVGIPVVGVKDTKRVGLQIVHNPETKQFHIGFYVNTGVSDGPTLYIAQIERWEDYSEWENKAEEFAHQMFEQLEQRENELYEEMEADFKKWILAGDFNYSEERLNDRKKVMEAHTAIQENLFKHYEL